MDRQLTYCVLVYNRWKYSPWDVKQQIFNPSIKMPWDMRQSNEIETNSDVHVYHQSAHCNQLLQTIKYKRDDHYLSSEIEINKVTYSHATFLFKW